ncbi:PASTA domain-containing protein [Pseudonocardia humida]|uniref:PASTA domain-containing protein n=1 Tax=Pseudonocardia humida TaxID=2800819 RepID=A0ABT0ZU73_9PSEU|nr:PASTA domain-containing protein [Pseudonocardia humida]MCO1654280.1 PASTA domain-containing protein [Pseudonocardia humida]
MRPAATVPSLVALAAALLAGCGSPTPTPTAPSAPAPAPAVATTPSAGAALPTATPAAADTVPVGGGSWTMPDLVGTGLQDAQDAIQGLTDFGIAVTTSHDATGQHRQQVADRNWKVCDQSVPPGATITPDTAIDFGAVKLDETC